MVKPLSATFRARFCGETRKIQALKVVIYDDLKPCPNETACLPGPSQPGQQGQSGRLRRMACGHCVDTKDMALDHQMTPLGCNNIVAYFALGFGAVDAALASTDILRLLLGGALR
jgi:hypothetical protein